jgi:hypothetical protein
VKWERDKLKEMDEGAYVNDKDGKILVKDWAWTFLATKGHLAPKTYTGDARKVNKQIVGKWGDRPLNSLTHVEIQQWLSSMPGAPATVKMIHGLLSEMLELAVRDHRLTRNEISGLVAISCTSSTSCIAVGGAGAPSR